MKTTCRATLGVRAPQFAPFVILALVALMGCAEVQDVERKINSALGPAPMVRPTPDIKDTPLYNIFKNHPIENGTYPRVAIRVLTAPADHDVAFLPAGAGGPSQLQADCWTLSATVWTSATQSSPISKFGFCDDADDAFGVPTEQASNWLNNTNTVILPNGRVGKTTGSVMTDGPTPPFNRYPKDPQSEAWFTKPPTSIMSTRDFFMLEGILYDTGFNWSDESDYRIWFVSVPPK